MERKHKARPQTSLMISKSDWDQIMMCLQIEMSMFGSSLLMNSWLSAELLQQMDRPIVKSDIAETILHPERSAGSQSQRIMDL